MSLQSETLLLVPKLRAYRRQLATEAANAPDDDDGQRYTLAAAAVAQCVKLLERHLSEELME